MKPELRHNRDFLAGLLFLAIGAAAVVAARDYPMGTAMRMGSGYFPTVLGAILGLFGIYLIVRGIASGARVEGPWGWRPLAMVVLSMVLFAFLMSRAGLVPALVAMFLVCAAAGREFRLKEVLLLTVVMSAVAIGVFVYGLRLPFQLVAGF